MDNVEPAIVIGDDSIRLELLDVGAAVRRLDVRLPDGTWRNVVLGHPDVADYRGNHGYLGASVGRFANRIDRARFSLDGREYVLDANEPPNILHGGTHGFGVIDWTRAGSGADWAEFTLVSPDGDQGFPGELTARVRFEAGDSRVRIAYTATTDAALDAQQRRLDDVLLKARAPGRSRTTCSRRRRAPGHRPATTASPPARSGTSPGRQPTSVRRGRSVRPGSRHRERASPEPTASTTTS